MPLLFSNPPPSPPPYTTGAVGFDGATYLSNAALVAIDTTSVFSYSMWIFCAGQTSGSGSSPLCLFDPANQFNGVNITDSNNPPVGIVFQFFEDVAGVNTIDGDGSTAVTTSSWTHVLGTISTDAPAGSRTIVVKVNGENDNQTFFQDAGIAFASTYNGLPAVIFGDGSGNFYTGYGADIWLSPGQSLLTAGDISPETIAKFFSAGKPVDLGSDGSTPTGTAPAIFLRRAPSAAASTFATNLGTGGDFDITGTLTIAPSSPTD